MQHSNREVIKLLDNTYCIVKHSDLNRYYRVLWSHWHHIFDINEIDKDIAQQMSDRIIDLQKRNEILLNPDYEDYQYVLQILINAHFNIDIAMVTRSKLGGQNLIINNQGHTSLIDSNI